MVLNTGSPSATSGVAMTVPCRVAVVGFGVLCSTATCVLVDDAVTRTFRAILGTASVLELLSTALKQSQFWLGPQSAINLNELPQHQGLRQKSQYPR